MMIRVQATNTLAILVSALSIASVFLTHTLFVFTKNVQFETVMMKKEYSQYSPFDASRGEVELIVARGRPTRYRARTGTGKTHLQACWATTGLRSSP
jgi:hypothetical protein